MAVRARLALHRRVARRSCRVRRRDRSLWPRRRRGLRRPRPRSRPCRGRRRRRYVRAPGTPGGADARRGLARAERTTTFRRGGFGPELRDRRARLPPEVRLRPHPVGGRRPTRDRIRKSGLEARPRRVHRNSVTAIGAPPILWRVVFASAPETAPALAQAIEPYCLAVGWFGDERATTWRVEGLAAEPLDRAGLHAATRAAACALKVRPPELHLAPLPERDWVRESLASFRPVQAGRYRIKGSHVTERIRPGVTLVLDAGMAFGTGEHASTRGCLLALDRLARARRFVRVLDLGCGTGVLAMAAAATWKRARVTAADIDPDAVATTLANARRNRLGPRIAAWRADGFARPALARRMRACARGAHDGRFDLVLANILARPLRRLARSLRRALAPGGIAVLSGFIAADAAWVAGPYRAQGFRLVGRADREGWTTLTLRRGMSGA
ncbi:MAG: methyltransferase domain-containing protein [Rhodospirillales bacterium]|nr:methyltransferase domain-containing protein [Rhodospirillales bacterium]